ncbi:PREDICTED: exocyst complex component EXO70A1-like [Tarenaya hassleriana]|uniref:exocyst complex component EXO70A1-like n=1 Tax=Tarenaya hassleriana TaxID=28532 RepID=UPI00053C6E13|nr:PREDICTED: exocyst complex component EXO70A1-like [Tarenaya hassleriana]
MASKQRGEGKKNERERERRMMLFKTTSSLSRQWTKSRSHQSFSESLMADTIVSAEAIVNRWISPELHDSSVSSSFCTLSSLFSPGNREEGRRFVEVIGSLRYAMQSVMSVNPGSKKLDRAQNLMRIAMKHLQREFYRILKSNRRYLDPESVSVRTSRASDSTTSRCSSRSVSDSELDGESDSSNSDESKSESERGGDDADVMEDLKMIADCMISCGHDKECVNTYKKIRKSIIVESLDRLGFENLSLSQIQKLDWEILEKTMKNWLRTARVAVTTLFCGERILCDHVFSSSDVIRESCFAEIALDSALSLFGFPENVAKCRLTSEKVFITLDVYQAISNLMLQIELVFSYGSTSSVKLQAIESQSKLGETIRSMLGEFETSISMESSKSPIPGGGVHQLARYVMNFIVFLADYSDSLAGILTTETPSTLPEDFFGGGGTETAGAVVYSPVATKLAWLILVLLCKIDAKSRLYNDVALSYLFLANNLNYIVDKVSTSNLMVVLGEDWVTKHEEKVRQFVAKCEKIAWGGVMTSLSGETEDAEEILRRFNEAFEEAYKTQSSWVVPDPKLRDEIKVSAAGKLIPAYSEFYKNQNMENVRFAPEDLGNYLSDLYFGSGGCISSDSTRPRR